MGFVDLQVNGYAGVDFNRDALTEQQMAAACQQMSADGVDQILATIITAPLEKMLARITRVVELVEANATIRGLVRGLHVEGPFLNPADGFAGATRSTRSHRRRSTRRVDFWMQAGARYGWSRWRRRPIPERL